MVRGAGPDTVVLMHHYDVVSVEDFKLLKPLAFSPDKLEEELRKLSGTLAPEVQADLASGAYLSGRGVCDMKGGGSIQMALLRRYSELVLRDPAALPGNLMVLAVPDEENLSAGMRAAAPMLLRSVLGLHGEAQPSDSSTASKPNAAAERISVPTLPGSCTPSRIILMLFSTSESV